jgi:prepilin-type N-terminal cleavage/methylation domain-containing protein
MQTSDFTLYCRHLLHGEHVVARHDNMRGFSLVELSIVLVILGLLTGGILAGQSLIRASELRAVTTEYQRYATATQTFRDKYFALPGDFRDATRFWQRMTNTADCITNSTAAVNAAGSCDGDADAFIEAAAAASQSGEMFHYWRQLALAGLVEGTYSGVAGGGGTNNAAASGRFRRQLPAIAHGCNLWRILYGSVLDVQIRHLNDA